MGVFHWYVAVGGGCVKVYFVWQGLDEYFYGSMGGGWIKVYFG